MKVFEVSASDIDYVVRTVSRDKYGGNLALKSLEPCDNAAGPRARFTIRVLDGAAGQPGARGNPRLTGTGPHGMRRGFAACWHAHWDVIEALLTRYPGVRVVSGLRLDGRSVVYTAATFRETALRTAHLDIGTSYTPVTMPECCECDHSLYTRVPALVDSSVTGQHTPATAAPAYQVTDHDDDPFRYNRESDRLALARADAHVAYTESYDGSDFKPDTSVPYLDGLPPAQPWRKYGSETVAETLGEIDKLID